MAGQYKFKDTNGNVVSSISGSNTGVITFSGSLVDFSNTIISGTISNSNTVNGLSSSAFVFTSSFNTISSSVSSQLITLQTTSGSNIGRLNNLESKSASVDISISSINNVTASFSPRVSNLESKSASVDISISNLNSFTASNNITSLNSKTSSYATTGSNTFVGTQIISGSTYIQGDLVVQGSSSIQYISASSVSIGTNIVNLNTANPIVRFGGLSVIDSGSASGKSGSFLFDSRDNEWIFVHQGNVAVTSSTMITGPETFNNLGEEIHLTDNVIPKSLNGFHIYDSCITDNGSTICFNTPTGSFSGKLGVGASNPRWQVEICGNNACTGAGGYPGISINNGCTTGYSGLYLYNGINQQGGIEASNSTGNILVNASNVLSLQTASNNRISIANTGAVTLSCQLYLDGFNRDTVFVKSNNTSFSRLFYAGNNQIVFHNGNTTACGGAWGLNNYEDTVGLFRVYNSGISCWYGGMSVCGNISIMSTCSKFYLLANNCKSADSVLDIYNTATNGYGASIQAGANSNNYALSVTNYSSTALLHVAGNGQVGIGCSTPNAKLTINNGDCVGSIRIYGSNSSYISQVGWYDSTNIDPASDGIGGQRVALIEIQTVAGSGTGCRGANMNLYTHTANGSIVLPLLLMHNGNVCLPQGNLYTTCTLFAPGTPIQVVTGTANVTSGAQGTGYSLVSNAAGTTPAWNDGLQIASTSFTPKSASSKILIMTNSVVMWERTNVSDHFYLWASNYTDGIVLVKSGQYLNTFGPGGQNGGIINLNGAFSSWGASAKTISFRIGTTGGNNASFEWNPYYGAAGFNADTVGNFTYTIMEIAQ